MTVMRIGQIIKGIKILCGKPERLKLIDQIRTLYHDRVVAQAGIRVVEINELVDFKQTEIILKDFYSNLGNVKYKELLYICAIVKQYLKPGKPFLEIGTFDGNTISNIARNVPQSICYTLDLPIEEKRSYSIASTMTDVRKNKRYAGLSNVNQIYCDSTIYDFSQVPFQGAFIDGGHTFDIVISDTRNVLRHILRPGFILWHDYNAGSEVGHAINEFASEINILKINRTSICFAFVE